MRKSYRAKNVQDYWQARWENLEVDAPIKRVDKYPANYSIKTLKYQNLEKKDYVILEAGCGNGRLVRYFHYLGYNIVGIDYVESAIRRLAALPENLKVEVANIMALHFKDGHFTTVLAFGLYHNFEPDEMVVAIRETCRILRPGGTLCASFRADNIQNWLNDKFFHQNLGSPQKTMGRTKEFHKVNLNKSEIEDYLKSNGFKIRGIFEAENMPLLYKFKLFRSAEHKNFDERRARKEGCLLSPVGELLQNVLRRFFRSQFCNLYVVIAEKR